jgi:hypothetical protein
VEGNVVKAAEVIKEATAAGVRIAIDGDGLLLEATTAPPKAMIALITQHKAEIIDLLRSGRGGPAEAEANNLQQSWRFDWEPPKAVLRDVRTIDWILGWLRFLAQADPVAGRRS